MKKIILILAILVFATSAKASEVANLSAQDALVRLKQGNERFVKMKLKHPDTSIKKRLELTKGQHPFVTILSCSDSRVPVELIFDQGLGDIFVIRNAGNVLDEHVVGSIEYAVEHLGTNLVVVLGHQSCGAVGAAMSHDKDSKAIESLKKEIEPAIKACQCENKYTYENVIKKHAKQEVDELLADSEFRGLIEKHQLIIMPAYYNLDTGKVEFDCK